MKRYIVLFILILVFIGIVYSEPTDAQIRQAANTLGVPFEDLKIFVQSYWGNNIPISNNSHKSIDDLLEHISRSFSVSNKEGMWFQMIGAIDGCRVSVNGSSIEIYKFDINDPGQKTIVENAQRTNTMSMMGITFPVLVNGSFMIVNYTEHPERNNIIEVFRNF
jgi:hypothetical protein